MSPPEDGHLAACPEQLILQVVKLFVGQGWRLVEVEGLHGGTAGVAQWSGRLVAHAQHAGLLRIPIPHPQGFQELLLLLANGFP